MTKQQKRNSNYFFSFLLGEDLTSFQNLNSSLFKSELLKSNTVIILKKKNKLKKNSSKLKGLSVQIMVSTFSHVKLIFCKHSVFWVSLSMLKTLQISALNYAYSMLKIIASVFSITTLKGTNSHSPC